MKKAGLLLLLLGMFLCSAAPKGDKKVEPLGSLWQATLATQDLKASVEFWTKLGFRKVMAMEKPTPWVQMTDETILIYLITDPGGFQRLSYFSADYEGTLQRLKKSKIKPSKVDNDENGKPWRAIFSSPDGFETSLVNRNPSLFFHPQGKTMLTMDPADYTDPSKMPTPLGMFGEFCHKVQDLDVAMAYFEKMGFKALSKNAEPAPWAIMEDGHCVLGLHETTDWSGCAITYFAPDMKDRIAKLKEKGITGQEYDASNIIIKTPEGAQLFLFSL